MIVNQKLLEDLYNNAGQARKQRALEYVAQKKVDITKVIYDDSRNFEVRSKVKGNNGDYDVFIKVENDEIQNLTCECLDYEQHYGACKHIIATMMEFSENNQYIRIFAGQNKIQENDLSIYKNYDKREEKYRTFKQVINAFYNKNDKAIEEKRPTILPHSIKIEPRIIYSTFNKNLKIEFKIGNNQLYKIKKLPEFYTRMLNKENYKYGTKLQFIHEEEAFAEESIPLLNYILKYAEIIKYANETSSNYGYYGTNINDSYITISNSGMDELFEILKNQEILMQKEYSENKVLFLDTMPNIEFKIKEEGNNEYKIVTNIDVYDYEIIEGRKYVYFLMNNILYKCDKNFEETTLKLLQIFRDNFTSEILLKKSDLPQLFSLVFPKIKENIKIDELEQEEIEKYIPKELFVKLYLDYNQNNHIIANIKFVYGDEEFNPLLEQEVKIARNIVQEDEVLEMFRKSGFMLDISNARLILADEDAIYNFLSVEIETYMQKFEVLATQTFKEKEIKQPKIGTLGVRIENNLLQIDLSNLDFDPDELEDIMEKYRLKKKYHRLKNGSFLSLEENETIDFIDGLTKGIDIDYKEIEKGSMKLPIFRSMYLERLLQKLKTTNIARNAEYKNLVDNIEHTEKEIMLPQGLNAELREYQKIGYKWLKILDEYKMGGILADDMGLGKTIQVIAVILSYIEKVENEKKSLKNTEENNIKTIENIQSAENLKIVQNSENIENIKIIRNIENAGNVEIIKDTENTENEDKLRIAEQPKPSIVVCPSSLSLNWKNEIEKFAPKLKTAVITGTLEERNKKITQASNYNIIITSYDLLKRDIEMYEKIQFRYIIADEAQYIKNNNTQNSKAIKKLVGETKFALTGTPIENSLSELWSIFDFTMSGYLFGYKKFKEMYETPIVKEDDENAMKKLKMLIEPFILRRVKKEVLTELPDKTITILNNEMQDEQQKIYLSYLQNAKREVKEEINTRGFEKSQIKILALLMRLRQICCHPALFIENYKGESSKLNQCIQVLQDAIDSGHKILLFSGYTTMFEIIEKELKKQNIKYLKLTGQTKVGERIGLVEEFNNNEEIKVFLISLKAGGTGLNLIGADVVIHYDPWWNLSAENQATDRTYRIGQKRNVQVYKLITKNSIEEKIYELQQKKEKLIDNMLSTNETFINKLSKEDIMELFS